MIFKDYYKILGLDTNKVSLDVIKDAYRKQAKKYHPDVNVGNKAVEERFKEYQVDVNMTECGIPILVERKKTRKTREKQEQCLVISLMFFLDQI